MTDLEPPVDEARTEHDLEPQPEWQPVYPGSGRLDGKVAIISGADSGIGRAVAALFAREGADIAILYGDAAEERDARDTAAAVQREGRSALLFCGDIGDPEFCRATVATVVEEFGGIDILVNNAGEQHPAESLEDLPEDQLVRTFQTNVFGLFHLTKAALPHLGEGAAIVNTTSVTSFKGSDELLDYSATKGAITSFTRALASQLAKDGVRVNAVAPGPIWTPLNPKGGATRDKLETFGRSTPMGRPGQPNEVAPCFLFLACRDSSYMTGQVLHPNGGEPVGG